MAAIKGKPRGKPFPKGHGGRPKGIPNKATQDVKAFAQAELRNPVYLAGLRKRLETGTAGAVETLLWHYGYGQPKNVVSVEGALPKFVVDLLTHGDGD